ncbi:hypothetical protein K432DRAFT_384892 [Lepidopterella palustris CBS 459.81]|uniref:SMP domain-containing protein n=1 Tax=Lepidopterella palustris CBS 459.81 TaxID=1314670 RepID=A0A8E2E4R8_9PEZI|nr:hypothetical protein K432DRAFT_384892 [Lepidopterella palustris CBS 459.81]
MSQPSYSTTTNNRDTSGATVLAAAPDAEAREAQEGWSENAQLNAGRGLGKAEGRGPTYATPGDERAMAAREGGGGVGGQEYNTSTGSGRNVGTAPTGGYAGASEQAKPEGDFRPKGKGITEGGIDGDAPNASFNQDVGGKKDPGRLAEREFQKGNAGGAGIGPRQVDVSGEVIYDTLTVDEET